MNGFLIDKNLFLQEEHEMKRILSIVLAVAVLATMCLSLASCGKKLSGKYSADVFGTGTTMTFDGKKVKIGFTVTLLGVHSSLWFQ